MAEAFVTRSLLAAAGKKNLSIGVLNDMTRVTSRRRVTIAAAGLTLSAAFLAGCGHARGERATANADSAALANSAVANDPSIAASGTVSANPSATTTTPAPNNRESTDAPRSSASRSNSYEVSPVPSDRPARIRTRVRANRSDATAAVSVDNSRSTAETRMDASRMTEPARTTTDVSVTPPAATVNSNQSTTTATVTPPAATVNSYPSTTTATVTPPAAMMSRNANTTTAMVMTPSTSVTVSPAATPTTAGATGAAAVTACFTNGTKTGLEYPSARTDATVETTPTDAGNKPAPIQQDPAPADRSMAPAARAEVTVVPSDHANATVSTTPDAAMTPAQPAPAAEPSGRIVPCMKSGDKSGRAAGAFINDAQIAHATLIANTVDSAVSVAAARRASNPAVREFAEMMIRDHTAANQKEAALLTQLHINPAENDISNAMLGEVSDLTKGMGSTAMITAMPMGAQANARVTTTTTTTDTHAAAMQVDRDTLHLSNPFVAAANMQPWTSLLAGMGDSSISTAARVAPVTATVTTTPAMATVAAPAAAVTSDFDRKYIDYQVNFHQKVLDALDSRLIPWAGPELRALLEETRPAVAAHLERARGIQRSLQSGASSNY